MIKKGFYQNTFEINGNTYLLDFNPQKYAQVSSDQFSKIGELEVIFFSGASDEEIEFAILETMFSFSNVVDVTESNDEDELIFNAIDKFKEAYRSYFSVVCMQDEELFLRWFPILQVIDKVLYKKYLGFYDLDKVRIAGLGSLLLENM